MKRQMTIGGVTACASDFLPFYAPVYRLDTSEFSRSQLLEISFTSSVRDFLPFTTLPRTKALFDFEPIFPSYRRQWQRYGVPHPLDSTAGVVLKALKFFFFTNRHIHTLRTSLKNRGMNALWRRRRRSRLERCGTLW